MDKNHSKKVYVYPLDRLSLEPLSFNLPFPHQYSPPSSLQELVKHRPPVVQTDRQEKTSSIKTLSGLKQILSRSLFHKKQPQAALTKQNLRDGLTSIKADTKPISPESQQKQPSKTEKLLGLISPQFDDIDNEGRFSNTDEILDTKFNKILDFQEPEIDLQIESKFISMKSQKSLEDERQDIQLLQPCATFQSLIQHERLLEEENGYIRQQLITFTQLIEMEKSRASQYKHKAKSLKKQNVTLRQQTRLIQAQLLQKEEQFYNMSVQNQEYKIQIQSLTQGKEELRQKFDQLSKDFEDICSRLQNYESLKDKEIENLIEEKQREQEQFIDEITYKQKEIEELTHLVEGLTKKLTHFEGSPRSLKKQRSTHNIEEESGEEQEEEDQFAENKMKNSSICLSLAEAESLKNIIESKQKMFEKELETLRTKSINEERSNSKIIEDLTTRIQQYQQQLSSRTQKKEDSSNIQQLKSTYTKRINALQLYLQEEREENARLQERLLLVEQKENAEKDQDDELEDLLENCVNELEKQRSCNFMLREEIHRLKKAFTKELYYVQDIENNVFIN